MTKLLYKTFAVSSVCVTLFVSGCSGGSSSSDSVYSTTSGQLIDSYVQNVDYSCADGSSGITSVSGNFTCKAMPVSFKLGGLKLGSISILPTDKRVFPQDIFSVPRADVNNTNVVALARLLQSADENNNSGDGLNIRQTVKNAFINEENFNPSNLNLYASDANISLIPEADAIEHLSNTTQVVEDANAADIPAEIVDEILAPNSILSQELKNTLAYMGNEERLAHDLYLKLYETYALNQLQNIATNSETQHIKAVQLLIQKYIVDISEFTNIDATELNYKYTDVNDMQMGVYDIQAIQNLYDALLAKGLQSPQDALEVGCMVEVTDINDLDEDIALAHASNATDIESTFTFLRNGSYNHYWAFNQGLISKGVANGCCVLGTDFCHPEYPKN
ncbi:MAG: DUF2202 domain-containing protein [Sulfurimonas sp.]|nr:DUF2202 domain-containing protein [Sulfurimonas sp.]